MEYFMVPTQKVPSLQHFRKTEKEVIGGLCRSCPSPSLQPSGPGAADPAGDRQQQRAEAHAEHQRGLPVPQDPHPPHRRREAQQGSHSAADSRVHLLPGAGEDQALAAEHTAQALHPGAERLIPQAAAGRRQGRRHWVTRYLGGREGGGPAPGDDRAETAAGQGALGAHDAGRAGEALGLSSVLQEPCFVPGLRVRDPAGSKAVSSLSSGSLSAWGGGT
uniref:Transcription factor AP-4 n=1 Tax=Ursus americanus TaxID=9643 RepID=A0A452QME1_URSAM